jgi:hypothetical protein
MTRASKRKATEALEGSSSAFAGESGGSTPQEVADAEDNLAAEGSQISPAASQSSRASSKKIKTENHSISSGTALSVIPAKPPPTADSTQPPTFDSEVGPSTRSKKQKASESALSGGAQISAMIDTPDSSQPITAQASGDKSGNDTSTSTTNYRQRMRKQESKREAIESAEFASPSSMTEDSQVFIVVDDGYTGKPYAPGNPVVSTLSQSGPSLSAMRTITDEQTPITRAKDLLRRARLEETGLRDNTNTMITTRAKSTVQGGFQASVLAETTSLEDHTGPEISRASSIVSPPQASRAKNQKISYTNSGTPSVSGKHDV